MKDMLMICDDESVILSPAEVHALPQIQAWVRKWTPGDPARRRAAPAKQPPPSATARCRYPMARSPEPKEQAGGFDIIGCASLDEAVEIAARHPAAASGTIEIRPLWQE
jgi:hypothetical protein